MERKDIECINDYVYRFFLHIMDSEDAGKIADALEDDIARDIDETADSSLWHSGDIEIAMKRVLMKRIIGEDYDD